MINILEISTKSFFFSFVMNYIIINNEIQPIFIFLFPFYHYYVYLCLSWVWCVFNNFALNSKHILCFILLWTFYQITHHMSWQNIFHWHLWHFSECKPLQIISSIYYIYKTRINLNSSIELFWMPQNNTIWMPQRPFVKISKQLKLN